MSAAAPIARSGFAKEIRRELAAQREALRAAYRKRPNPDQNLKRHSALVDKIIRRIADEIGMPDTLAVAAVGGYGRGVLFPASDVDLVVLLPDDAVNAAVIESFVSLLWDVGLEPGIAVRTIAECVEEAKKDVTVDTSLLEVRAVWGNAELVDALRLALKKSRSLADFFAAKIDEQRRRHARHNDVALNLEPNIKESPGGLRDLQTVMWLARAAELDIGWNTMAAADLVTVDEERLLNRHRHVLVDLRIRLHYLAGRREDRLVFDHQNALARELGLQASGNRSPSEVLMQRYYLSAKAVWQMSSILIPNLLQRLAGKTLPRKKIDEEFELVGGNIAAKDLTLFAREPKAVFRAFLALQRIRDAEFFAPETLRAMWRAAPSIDRKFREDPEANRLFLQILQSEKVTFSLRRMSRYGILGRYLPAFGRITGQMQHDLFHVYSVDEHILMVVRNLRRLVLPRFAHEFPFCHELAREFARPEILYLAALFHDIAKGRGGDHSDLGKKDARLFCKKLGISKADTELVTWLVEMHLQMSAVAQKQDLSDPEVIAQFAARVVTERRLVALYLLTVADIRGTSPHVWNGWKAQLLENLFRATRRLLRGDSMPNEFWIETKKNEARLRLGAEHPVPALWNHVDPRYFQRFDAIDIAWHAEVLEENISPVGAVVRARAADSGEGISVMVMRLDLPGLFARITQFFERLGFDIASARIYTTAHGYALDMFQVLPKHGKVAAGMNDRIERDLASYIDVETPIAAGSAGRVARQVRHFPITPQVTLQPSRHQPYYELSISCADRPGLLSSIARVLLEHRVSLEDARVNTLGQRAEDVFVIEGAALESERMRLGLREAVAKVLAI